MRKHRRGANFYERGSHNIIDDIHGEKIKSSDMRMRWDGIIMHRDDWEERHPQDFIRGIKERIGVDHVRNPPDEFGEGPAASEL